MFYLAFILTFAITEAKMSKLGTENNNYNYLEAMFVV